MIPEGFNYSQSSLKAFGECRRRFLLRYLRRMEWPAPLTDRLSEWEGAINRGSQFHHLILQQSLGLDVEESICRSDDQLLVDWWRNWCELGPELPLGKVFSETMLSVPLASRRLVAKFDRVLADEDGGAWIFDWKTGRKKPDEAAYMLSWQTLVYRFVLAEAGAVLNTGRAVDPQQIMLVYWHANYPRELCSIGYSAEEHEEARVKLAQITAEIEVLAEELDFAKTDDLRVCSRCEFHTYCGRQSKRDGDWDVEEESDMSQNPNFETGLE